MTNPTQDPRKQAIERAKEHETCFIDDECAHCHAGEDEWQCRYARALLAEVKRNGELEAFQEHLRTECDRLRRNLSCVGVHTCHDACQNPMCLMRKERDKLLAEVAVLREALEKFDKVHFTESGASCAYGSDIAYKALSSTTPSKLMAVVDAALEEAIDKITAEYCSHVNISECSATNDKCSAQKQYAALAALRGEK